jgi:hypothetical protein
MARSRKLEETLAKLAQIRDTPTSEAGITTLREVLGSKNSVAVAQAAKMVGEFVIAQLIPELVAAFARMMVNPSQTDRGCLAKKEIAEALYRLEYSEESLFIQGIRHVQVTSCGTNYSEYSASILTSLLGIPTSSGVQPLNRP